MRDAILVRVDDLTVQSTELRQNDLEEVVEQVLRFCRLWTHASALCDKSRCE